MNKAKINTLLFALFMTIIIVTIHLVRWENANAIYIDNWQDYEVLILDDNEVMLYKSDLSDSIHMRLENAYNLVGEEMIQVNHPIKHIR